MVANDAVPVMICFVVLQIFSDPLEFTVIK